MSKLIQGDVILRKISNLPENLTKLIEKDVKGNRILQHSEVTGHHHHFKPTAKIDVYTDSTATSTEKTITIDMSKFIVVHETSALYHGKTFTDTPNVDKSGDHNSVTVMPGIYKVNIVREYDYEKEETTTVVD